MSNPVNGSHATWNKMDHAERSAILEALHERLTLTRYDDRTAYNEAHDHMLAACRAMAEHDRKYVSGLTSLPPEDALQTSLMLLAKMARTFLEQAYEELATLDTAFSRGWDARAAGKDRAPALDPWVRERSDRPAGDPLTYAILWAWLQGYDEAETKEDE